MDSSVPSSRAVIAWTVVVFAAFLVGGILVLTSRAKHSRPRPGPRTTDETSIPQPSLEERARDFRKPARERRYQGKFVEVAGTVVSIAKMDGLGQQSKPALLVYLAPEEGKESLVCGACPDNRASANLRIGEVVVLQGTVGVLFYEGPNQVGLVDARIVRRGLD